MGCDITSKVGTKHAVVKADPLVYLGQFWGPIVWYHVASRTLSSEGTETGNLSLPRFPFVRGEVLPATSSPPHLIIVSTLLCLLSSSYRLPPLLHSSHIVYNYGWPSLLSVASKTIQHLPPISRKTGQWHNSCQNPYWRPVVYMTVLFV